MEKCKIDRLGESCRRNNNCKYPNCETGIKENNKLIAGFMGGEKTEVGNNYINFKEQGKFPSNKGVTLVHVDSLLYHKSWGLLMPVVEKIQTLYETDHNYGAVIEISTNEVSIWYPNKFYFGIDSDNKNRPFDVKNTYKAVVEFIKWYNGQPYGD